MNNIQIDRRNIGVNINKQGTADVCVWAPKAEKISLIVNGNDTIALQAKAYGYWQTADVPLKNGDRYKFVINDKEQFPDTASLSQPDGVHEASEVVNINIFQWTDSEWLNPPLENYIIYELHTGTFSPEGTFEGIEKKLDYLIDLGITAIEIMPVAQFPGNRNWGYDGVYPFAVQNSYGGFSGLQHLVNSCHAKGLSVILDVVYNHLGPEGNYMDSYGNYFTDKYNTPWGMAVNFDDAWCDAVRQYFIENALMWLRDFHIDALRFDAVHAIKDFSATHILKDIRQHVNELMKLTGKQYHLIVECDLNDTRFINPIDTGGYAMDAQWTDEFHHTLRVTAGEKKTGYYADFNGVAHLAKAYKDAYVYDGQYSEERKKTFGIKATDNPGSQFVVFSQNHDQIGNRMLGERTSQLFSFEMQKLLAAAVIVSPYIPLLFMGEEWGETNPFLYFVSHTDTELAEAVRKGRKEEFKHFHIDGEALDPVAEETFQNSKLQWALQNEEPHSTMLQYYKALIALRKAHPALYHLSRINIEVAHDEQDKTIVLHRWWEHQHIVSIMNFSQQQHSIYLPTVFKDWNKIFDSADAIWNGPHESITNTDSTTETIVQPESITIYQNSYV